jgi:quaternary ammonium compound-resistance protein SugE
MVKRGDRPNRTKGHASMAWLMVVTAGLLEMVWSYSAKQADGFTKWGWAALTMVASLASFFLLTFSLRTLPLGTAYVVWTGLGAVGSFIVGALLLGEPLGSWRILSATLIVAGVIGLRVTSH